MGVARAKARGSSRSAQGPRARRKCVDSEILELATKGAKIGSHEFLPFSIEMPRLFETFVAEWLPDHLPEKLMIDAQRRVRLNANADLKYIFDIVLRDRLSGKALAVIDTKYKVTEQPSESDIQQVVAYAVELGVSKAHLIYPFALGHPIEVRTGDITVSTTGIDLGRPLSESGNDVARAVSPGWIS